eukprot:sb/3475944/
MAARHTRYITYINYLVQSDPDLVTSSGERILVTKSGKPVSTALSVQQPPNTWGRTPAFVNPNLTAAAPPVTLVGSGSAAPPPRQPLIGQSCHLPVSTTMAPPPPPPLPWGPTGGVPPNQRE